MTQEQRQVLQTATSETIVAVRELVSEAWYGALATTDPETGEPQCTRVGMTTLADGRPLMLASALAAHTAALQADPRCSLLIGEVAKGDPLAQPRVTLACRAEEIGRDDAGFDAALTRYLAAHPKARTYVDLPDFRFFALRPQRVRYVAGFGRAYDIAGEDIAAR